MNIRRLRVGAAFAAAALTGTIAACGEDTVDIFTPAAPASPIFTSYVALGNSITAGYQSGGINDSTQKESYARLVANQMRTRYAYPALAGAGCPPPTKGIARVRATDSTGTFCALRNPLSANAALNNVGVPGAATLDLTSTNTARSNFLTSLFLGGKTQVAKALDARPTFVSVWMGNNDVLDPGVKGVAIPDTGAAFAPVRAALSTPGITNFTAFRNAYATAANGLRARVTQGVLIGVVNVTWAPILFPVETLLVNPVRRAEFQGAVTQAAGGAARPVTIDPACTGSRALVSFAIVSVLAAQATDAQRVISCSTANGGAPFVLDTLEQAVFTSTITAYNSYIKAKADSIGYAYLNADSVLSTLRTNNSVYGAPHLQEARPFGPAVSNDGIHPALPGHQAVARALITTINAKYGTSIPQLP
ncbi:MAG TPA: SGNH/GDSL hydrolase family protein [Gemmatimonadaceae bacterium]|nr:SGNH/GDSL hydrolase family protein [Gemmatimonadaceae bacterium]